MKRPAVAAPFALAALAALVALAATAVAGCGSSPPVTFYALVPKNGAPDPGPPRLVEVRTPTIAGYLDRPEIVRGVDGYRLGLATSERWGEPLDEMIGRVLADDIQQRAPQSTVFGEGGSVRADADATVEVDVRRFETGEGGAVNLAVTVAVERAGVEGRKVVRTIALRAPAPRPATTAVQASTMSDLLGRLADRIVAMLDGG